MWKFMAEKMLPLEDIDKNMKIWLLVTHNYTYTAAINEMALYIQIVQLI